MGDEWMYEVKWDGFRVEAIKDGATVRLVSRNAKDLTETFPDVRDAVAALKADSLVLDGEAIAADEHGKPSFQALQHRASLAGRITYYAFDLLYLNDEDLRRLPLDERRRKLERTGVKVERSVRMVRRAIPLQRPRAVEWTKRHCGELTNVT